MALVKDLNWGVQTLAFLIEPVGAGVLLVLPA